MCVSESRYFREFPGCPMVRTTRSHPEGPGLIPGRGTKIQQKKKKKDTESRYFKKREVIPLYLGGECQVGDSGEVWVRNKFGTCQGTFY